jgi:hypothetical protein
MDIAVVQSVYGGYDHPVPVPEQTVPFTFLLANEQNYPRPHMSSRLASKHLKCVPWDYFDKPYDMYVWIDGSFIIKRDDWLEWLVQETDGQPVSQCPHPWRNCVYDEAVASLAEQPAKYSMLPVMQQAQHYLDDGHPLHWGLWSTGLMVYRFDTPEDPARLRAFGKDWISEQVKWGYQDQISEPYLLRKHFNRHPHVIADSLYNSPFISMKAHTREN